jgi:hypothetical protein
LNSVCKQFQNWYLFGKSGMAWFRRTFEIQHAERGKYLVVSGTDEAGVRAKAKQKEFLARKQLDGFSFFNPCFACVQAVAEKLK